jgi:hypothetical protein
MHLINDKGVLRLENPAIKSREVAGIQGTKRIETGTSVEALPSLLRTILHHHQKCAAHTVGLFSFSLYEL